MTDLTTPDGLEEIVKNLSRALGEGPEKDVEAVLKHLKKMLKEKTYTLNGTDLTFDLGVNPEIDRPAFLAVMDFLNSFYNKNWPVTVDPERLSVTFGGEVEDLKTLLKEARKLTKNPEKSAELITEYFENKMHYELQQSAPAERKIFKVR